MVTGNKKRWVSLYVENDVGVLAKISGLFSGKSYNLSSLTVGETEDPTVSRMTISLYGDDKTFEQIKKQLNRSVEVIKMPADQQLPFYDVDGMKIIFKHPYFHFDEEQYKSWDCGAVMGSVLLSKEEK